VIVTHDENTLVAHAHDLVKEGRRPESSWSERRTRRVR
jgi:hypothetical protein